MAHGDDNGSLLPLAVFDYDGTCIDGQSGRYIATWLVRRRYISMGAMLKLTWWGVRYKLHLPHKQELPREIIFNELGAHGQQRIERVMAEFHRDVLLPKYRALAQREIAARRAEGCTTLLVSATFEAIAREAAHFLGLDGYVATSMELDDLGNYTGKVQGDVIAGKAKVEVASAWANEHLGEGAWYLAYAYGDHHSDIELLAAAEHPYAVSPGPTLKRVARRLGWPIVDWDED